ncbi:MAG: peptidylprolyl isomerase [Methanomicrobiales archaeon]|nr:peptidylprolyl isomerase [Methanomicrobiales archaeon]
MTVSWIPVVIALCCALVAFSGCTSPQQSPQQAVARTNDTVTVFYTVSFADGQVFESNRNGTPLEFTIGAGQMIPGFDEAVAGMSPGQTKTVTVIPEKAYGPYREELLYTANTDEVRARNEELIANRNLGNITFPGMEPVYTWKRPDGSIGYLRFSNITEQTTTVDENHPLAGKDLVFEITLVEIVGHG